MIGPLAAMAAPLAGRVSRLALALAALILVVCACPPGAAAADCLALGTESIASDQPHYAIAEPVQLSGHGFAPSCDVSVYLYAPDGSVRTDLVVTDASGNLAYAIPPSVITGQYQVDLYGDTQAELAGIAFTNGPQVSTDKGDYRDNETVHITGVAFAPMTDLSVRVTRPDGSVVTGDGTNTPGTDMVTTDAQGAFSFDYIIRLGSRADYLVEILGPDGSALAATSYTDSGAFVKNIAATSRTTVTNSSITLTVPAAGLAGGNSIIVGLQVGAPIGAVSCSDPKNGAYNTDVVTAAGTTRVAIVSKHNVVALVGGDVITCTYPIFNGVSVVTANEFSGLSATALDQTAVGASSLNGAISTALTATTAQADEVLVGLFGVTNPPPNQTLTPGTGYTVIGSAPAAPTLYPMYKLVFATGGYAANGTLAGSGAWRGAIATYKVATVSQGQITIVKNTVGGNGTFSFAVSGTSAASPSVTTSIGSGSTTIPVPPGTYTVTEAAAAGWTLTGSSCGGASTSNFTVAAGATVTCTFTNAAQGQIAIVKNTIGADGTFDFTVSGTSAASPSVTTSGGSGSTTISVPAGTYSLNEAVIAGWALTSATCGGGSTTSFTVTAGATVSCTFNNTAQGQIKIVKNTTGGNGTFAFTVSGPGGSTPSVTTVGGTGATGFFTVTAGSYAVSEVTQANWVLTSSSCGGGSPASFTVPVGGSVTCTFDNTAQGRIRINKTAVGGDATFGFTIAGPSASTPGVTTSGGTGTTGLLTVTAGTYSVGETGIPANWVLTGSGCDSGTPGSFAVGVGGTVTCSFTNTGKGQLKIVKNTTGGNGTFQFAVSGATASSPAVTTVAGTGTTGLFTVTAGSYSIGENAATGWALSSAVCDAGIPGGFTLAVGAQVTCTFTNDKDTDGDGIPDRLDCNPMVKDTVVVDPNHLVPASFTGIRAASLQAAVTAAADNHVISMYADTIENVVIGASSGSGGKDLLIVGCGRKVTALDLTLPVIHIERSAGRSDGSAGIGQPAQERDIQVVDLDVLGGAVGYLVETTKAAGVGTDTLLKAIRATGNAVGVRIAGDGNEVRGANGVNTNTGVGIDVTGNKNLVTDGRILGNLGAGIAVRGDGNVVKANSVGDAGAANVGVGIDVTGGGNTIQDNGVLANQGGGIVVLGNTNLLVKNLVGDSGKGNRGDGIRLTGYGNTVQENRVFANSGDGINAAGGTSAKPNVIYKNAAGDRGKGNAGNGINLASAGNGNTSPVEIELNTVKSNGGNGIRVAGTGHQLKDNASGGSGGFPGGDDNGKCEFAVVSGNFNATGNKANGVAIGGASGSAFLTTCQGTL